MYKSVANAPKSVHYMSKKTNFVFFTVRVFVLVESQDCQYFSKHPAGSSYC